MAAFLCESKGTKHLKNTNLVSYYYSTHPPFHQKIFESRVVDVVVKYASFAIGTIDDVVYVATSILGPLAMHVSCQEFSYLEVLSPVSLFMTCSWGFG